MHRKFATFATVMAVIHMLIGLLGVVIRTLAGDVLGLCLSFAILGLAYVWCMLAVKARRAAMGDKVAQAFLRGYGSVIDIFPSKH